jgi:hypothetical protein
VPDSQSSPLATGHWLPATGYWVDGRAEGIPRKWNTALGTSTLHWPNDHVPVQCITTDIRGIGRDNRAEEAWVTNSSWELE